MTDGKVRGFLLSLLGAAVLAALVLAYFAVNPDGWSGWRDLLLGLLVSLIALLLASLVVYVLLLRRGIPTLSALARLDREAEPATRFTKATHGDVFENYREIPWDELLSDVDELDIVVCYFDSWVSSNWESLLTFFNGGGRMRIYLPDPEIPDVLAQVHSRFGEYRQEAVREKIVNTGIRLANVIEESVSREARLAINFYPGPLNYSAIRFGRESVLLSAYEEFRKQKIDSSAVLLKIKGRAHLQKYWAKEIEGFARQSREVDIKYLRTLL